MAHTHFVQKNLVQNFQASFQAQNSQKNCFQSWKHIWSACLQLFYSFQSMGHGQIGKNNDFKILKILFRSRGYPGITQIGQNWTKWLKTVFFLMLSYIFCLKTEVVLSQNMAYDHFDQKKFGPKFLNLFLEQELKKKTVFNHGIIRGQHVCSSLFFLEYEPLPK